MTESSSDEALIHRLDRLETELRKVETRLRIANRRLRNILAIGAFLMISGLVVATSPTAQAQFGVTLASLNTRLTAVENKTTPLSYNSTTKLMTVSGANVMIIDGTGATNSTTGLGNLQVGYNGLRGSGDLRISSHNLILGDGNNYASYGGLVAGRFNEITGIYASVSGGFQNTASGDYASVSGGNINTASGLAASVNGGLQNAASGDYTSVSGGVQNKASYAAASVSGGLTNMASGFAASVSGGTQNTASGEFASVSGGGINTASGNASSILGGSTIILNTAEATYPAGP